MTVLLENTKQIDFFTDLSKVIVPFVDHFRKLNWFVTDLEYIVLDKLGELDGLKYNDNAITISGEQLLKTIQSRQIQFVWGVFTGFSGGVPQLPDSRLPYADGNRELWTNPDKFQVTTAEIEIVCWDSSATIIKFKDLQLLKDFIKLFPDSKELKNDAFLFTVKQSFLLSGKGLMLIPGLSDKNISVGSKIILIKPDRTVIKTVIKGISSAGERGILIGDSFKKEDIPIGTEVWLNDK